MPGFMPKADKNAPVILHESFSKINPNQFDLSIIK